MILVVGRWSLVVAVVVVQVVVQVVFQVVVQVVVHNLLFPSALPLASAGAGGIRSDFFEF